MVLDTLSHVLYLDCSWVQTTSSRSREPRLIASHGFTPDMKRQVDSIDTNHVLYKEVIGLGHKIVIQDIPRNGIYGLSAFSEVGFRWLIVVPLMTYRMLGMMGVASRNKKHINRETPELLAVISNLIGTALNKTYLFQRTLNKEKHNISKEEPHLENNIPDQEFTEMVDKRVDSHYALDVTDTEGLYEKHAHRMKAFRKYHL